MPIRNFCIIAHIDHGKSTLADRMLEITNTIDKRDMKAQMLDQMELEREKGITIKLQPVRMMHGDTMLNLIDTPGHVDFQYEVSRSLQAVEGAILLVDATQGVQAQTVSNLYLAMEQDLTIIPVLNKIDLPAADVPRRKEELKQLLGVEENEILSISAKTGEGVVELLDAVIEHVPSPTSSSNEALQCLIFDSVYDDYKGVVAYVRVVSGRVNVRDQLAFLGTGISDSAVEVGVFAPAWKKTGILQEGEIGYIATGLKDVREARVGDTLVHVADKGRKDGLALPGFIIPQPKVFAGIYAKSGDDFPVLREAISKLQLNDASLTAQQERSEALGQGYRCGFLGMLHLEIIQERLRREFDLDVIVTTPSVLYKVTKTDGSEVAVRTPDQFPDPVYVSGVLEQYMKAEIIVPSEHLGNVFELMKQHEGELVDQQFLTPERVTLRYELPMRELVMDLYDRLKSATAGFGSLSYEMSDWRSADVVKLGMLVNHEPVEAMSVIVPRANAERIGRRMVEKLKEVIPRQMFAIPLQAAVGGTIVARETLPAMRKDVTAGLYGGDVTRKRKLLEKQKKGKKKMATGGSVDIPAEAYIAVLKR